MPAPSTRHIEPLLPASGAHNYTQSFNATLSFTSAQSKQPSVPLAATLSFTGAIAKQTQRKLTATLSFVSAMSRRTSALLTATLSFTGAISKRTSRSLAATLGFTGGVSKRTSRNLPASLSFVGNLVTGALHRIAFNAILSFTGNKKVAVSKNLGASLTFSGNVNRMTSRALTAALSFTGAFSFKKVIDVLMGRIWHSVMAKLFAPTTEPYMIVTNTDGLIDLQEPNTTIEDEAIVTDLPDWQMVLDESQQVPVVIAMPIDRPGYRPMTEK